jgi:hypothetical protein
MIQLSFEETLRMPETKNLSLPVGNGGAKLCHGGGAMVALRAE